MLTSSSGDVDTAYLHSESGNVGKRSSIGVYAQAQDVGYLNGSLKYPAGEYFPANWDPRYTLDQGIAADTDLKENYSVHPDGMRVPVVNILDTSGVPSPIGGGNGSLPAPSTMEAEYRANPDDGLGGFITNGSLPTELGVGVHSLSDVPVYAMGPCSNYFVGSYDNTDIYFAMAQCLGLSRTGGNPSGSNSTGGNYSSSASGSSASGSSASGSSASGSSASGSSASGSSSAPYPYGGSSTMGASSSSASAYHTPAAKSRKRACGRLGKCGGRYGDGKRRVR